MLLKIWLLSPFLILTLLERHLEGGYYILYAFSFLILLMVAYLSFYFFSYYSFDLNKVLEFGALLASGGQVIQCLLLLLLT